MTDRRRTFVPVVGGGLAAALLSLLTGGQLPAALSLVALACWGVVLVTRRVVRRSVAGLGVLTSLGLTVASAASLRASAGTWIALAAAVVSVVATALAVAWCPQWPEMGSRFDAPGGDRSEPPAEDRSSLDLWKSMDEGRDPTA